MTHLLAFALPDWRSAAHADMCMRDTDAIPVFIAHLQFDPPSFIALKLMRGLFERGSGGQPADCEAQRSDAVAA
jgi:hypothetical protein